MFHVPCSMKGMATFEMLIAMALLVVFITSVLPLVSGGQSFSISSENDQTALYKAKELLENARAASVADFTSVASIAPYPDSIYTKSLNVEDSPDGFTKKVWSRVSWNNGSQNLAVNLTTRLTNPLTGGGMCSPMLTGDWTNPQMTMYEFGTEILNDTSSGFPVTSIKIIGRKMYVTVDNNNGNNPGTFFILDISNPSVKPILLSPTLFDNSSVGAGLNAVAVDSGSYAYVANAYGADYTTCTNPSGTNYECGQLQVIDIMDSSSPSMEYSYKVTGVTGTSGQGIGTSIFYKDGIVYLGLSKATGPEFNIIDVGAELGSPTNPVLRGTFEMGDGVNAIYVDGDYAYIATPDNNQELKIFNISNPDNPTLVGSFNAPGGGANSGNGKSISLIDDTLYLGRTLLNGNEFYILDNSNPEVPLPLLGFKNILDGDDGQPPAPNNTTVNGIIIRDYLGFLITNSEFQILRIDDPSNITVYANPLILPPGSGNIQGTSSDCLGNYIFLGSQGSNDKGYISVITSTP